MNIAPPAALESYRARLREEYERRFARSKAHFDAHGQKLLDGTSHAVRWNEPFMPVAARASGAVVEDLDGNLLVDYWQGHYANLLGHNPPEILAPLRDALKDGRGLQSGMLHAIEAEVAETVCRHTGAETIRFTTSGSLGTFYAVVLARSFTGRDLVLKASGGWHGSQPFGLKGVSAHGTSFDHLESEGLSTSIGGEIELTRFNDTGALHRVFERCGDRIACFLLEPVIGAGGGIAATREYLREARRLTERHGALLLCDEIITGYRFRLGALSTAYDVRPDVLILGKVLGGGMPVAAVAGRRDVLRLGARGVARVKFEGGTYSAHELSLVATRALLGHLEAHGEAIYAGLGEAGRRMRRDLGRIAAECGVAVHVTGQPVDGTLGSSLVFVHVMREDTPAPSCPEELAERGHPLVTERLLKSTLLLEGVSTRAGLGAVSTAHGEADLAHTLEGVRAGFLRLREAGLV